MENMQEILPSGGLAGFHNEVSKLADLGRYEDAYIVHAAEGETVVPMEVFDSNPRLKEMLFNQMREMGIIPERYIVGNQFNSINPITGQPEFFLKKIFKEAKKALKKVAPYAGLIAGAMGAGPGWSALAGGLGSMYAGGEGLDDWQAGLTGAAMGYGAGTAFGTRAGGDYAFGSDEGFFQQLGQNLGLSPSGSKEEIARANLENSKEFTTAKMQAKLNKQDLTLDQFIKGNDLSDLSKWGSTTQASKMTGTNLLTTAAILTPLYMGLKAEEGDDTPPPEDITGKYPWTGAEFGDAQAIDPITGQPITYSAEGGIVQNFANGAGPFGVYYPEGDTDYDASQVINEPGVVDPTEDLDLFMGDDMAMDERADEEGIMMAMNTQEMLTVLDKETGNVVTITRAEFLSNPSRYSMAPKGIPSDFDVENLKQTIPMLGGAGVMGAGAGAAANEFFEGAAKNYKDQEGYQFDFDVDGQNKTYSFDEPGITDQARLEFLDREGIIDQSVLFDVARSIKPTGRLNMDDIQRAKELIMNNMEAFQLARERKSSGRINEDDIERAQKILNDYLGPRSEMGVEEQGDLGLRDGGIAYLAEGSFPRKTGAIAGPGGPKDDRVPAMLSDGEFVMTAKAVRNAGGGSRREGAKKMYKMMNRLEGTA